MRKRACRRSQSFFAIGLFRFDDAMRFDEACYQIQPRDKRRLLFRCSLLSFEEQHRLPELKLLVPGVPLGMISLCVLFMKLLPQIAHFGALGSTTFVARSGVTYFIVVNSRETRGHIGSRRSRFSFCDPFGLSPPEAEGTRRKIPGFCLLLRNSHANPLPQG